jgi:ABC-type uncharacterized transport system substrate-binding protein
MMRFRVLALAVAWGLLAVPLTTAAQPADKLYHIGWLQPAPPPPFGPLAPGLGLANFEHALRELGYVEGRAFVIERRFAGLNVNRLPALAAELVALKVDVIVTSGVPATKAAKEATPTIPIVMAGASDPVENGLVASLARPGGNVTGMTTNPGPELAGKGLELLKEAAPRISRVGVLWDSSGIGLGPSVSVQRSMAPKLGITLLSHEVKALDELRAALAAITRERADGLFVYSSPVNEYNLKLILEFAARNRVSTMFQACQHVESGGLMSYYTDWIDLRRRTATFVDKILKGAKPSELAIEQPTKLDLCVNLKTAKALGLTIPPSVLARADKIVR